MDVKKVDLQQLEGRTKEVYEAFKVKYGSPPSAIIRVPGRVNIIGEHIDYCGYAVHPMAIDQDVLVAVSRDETGVLELNNVDKVKYPDYSLDNITNFTIDASNPTWWGYFQCGMKGVWEECNVDKPKGLKLLLSGAIPASAGLSSSSALVVSAALVTVWANNIAVGKEELANICARSERFIGTQGGGMDQAIEILAEKGSAKLIEFNPLTTYNVTLPQGATFVVANTLEEKNKAASNDFNTRVVECRIAAKVLAKNLLSGEAWKDLLKLKDVQVKAGVSIAEMLDKVENVLHPEDYTVEEVMEILDIDKDYLKSNVLTPNTQNVERFRLYQRAKHVYSEADRVYRFRDTCMKGDGDNEKCLKECGQLMTESHRSCSELYQCSSPGLDTITSLALEHGALGARLTGAGWGGCMVALVPEDKLASFIPNILDNYYKPLNLDQSRVASAIFATKPGAGASIMEL